MTRRRRSAPARRSSFGFLGAALAAAAFATASPAAGAAHPVACAPFPQDAPATETRPAATIPWRRDLAAARAEAKTAGKPLCVVFRCEA